MIEKPSKPDTDLTQTSTGKTHLLAAGRLLAERYRIGDVLGIGGMGMVYKARDETLGLDVALKVLRDERENTSDTRTLDRFQQELILARQVSHRNVVRIHDIGRDGDVHFLTMDFVDGQSLKEILDDSGTLPVARALDLARQIASGLAAAHDTGVVHRDLKPANILVDAHGVPFITDFGVARSASVTGLTRTGHIVGTPDYLSPEQARGGDVDGRSDIYSLGLILYEMLSGQLPFSGETYQEVLAQRLMGKPRDLAELGVEVPASVKRIIEHCLASDPDDRYESASQLAADLGEGRGTQASARQRSKLARRFFAGSALAVLIAGGAAAIYWQLNRPAAQVPETAAEIRGPALNTVAIFPLVDDTGRPDLAWLRTGISELVADSLAENTAFQLVDTNRVFQTLKDLNMLEKQGSPADISQAAELLGANSVVTGSIRTAGPRIRVDARITAVGRGRDADKQVLAEAQDASEIFLLIRRLAEALRENLAVEDEQGTAIASLSDSEPALRAYTQGVRQLYTGNSVAAAPALEEAVAQDAGFAAAWLRLSEAYDALGYGEKSVQAIQNAGALLANEDSRIALEVRAQEALLTGDLERAQTVLATLAARYQGDTETRVALALAHADEGELDEAMGVLREVIAMDPNNPRAWFLMGKYAILTGDNQAAIDEYLVRALVIQNRLDNEQGRANVLNAMGIAYHQLGQLDQAEDHYREAAEIRTRIQDLRGMASSLSNLARILVNKGQFEQARVQFNEAMQSREAIGDQRGLAVLHNELGLLEENAGDYRAALQQFRQSLNIRRQLGDRRALSESYSNVGFAYYTLGEYDNASVYWRQALDTATELDNPEDIMLASQNLGLLDFARGRWEESLKSFLGTLDQARSMENPVVQAVSMGNLGRIAMNQGRYAAAVRSLDDAIALLEQHQDRRGQAEYKLFKTELALALGMREEGQALIEEIRALLTIGGNREQLAELRRAEGELALQNGDHKSAGPAFAAAVGLARESGNPVIRLRAELSAAKGSLLSGQHAGLQTETMLDEIDRIGNVPLQLRSLELSARIALANKDFAAAETSARRLLRTIQSVGIYEGGWRAYQLLAAALQGQGKEAQAKRARQEAMNEVSRLEENLDAMQSESFRRLPQLRELRSDT